MLTLLISSLITLQSENMLCIFQPFESLCLKLWSSIESIFDNVPFAIENNVHSELVISQVILTLYIFQFGQVS